MNTELAALIDAVRLEVRIHMKRVWNIDELAAVLGITASRVRHLVADRVLPSYKQNGSLYFKRDEIEAWMTAHRTPSRDELETQAQRYCAANPLVKRPGYATRRNDRL